jgi:hypothetical protein
MRDDFQSVRATIEEVELAIKPNECVSLGIDNRVTDSLFGDATITPP